MDLGSILMRTVGLGTISMISVDFLSQLRLRCTNCVLLHEWHSQFVSHKPIQVARSQP